MRPLTNTEWLWGHLHFRTTNGGKIMKNCVVMVTIRDEKGLLRALEPG
jgi:hypothetical protein